MLFLQPVVVDDARAADRSAPAEVRIAERPAHARMTWTGATLAQNGPMDGRSPFGPNAPGANDLTPDRPLVNQHAGPMESSPTAAPASPSDPASTTKIPPVRAPDSGPPPGTTTTNPDTTTDTVAPGTVAPPTATPSTTAPGTTPTPATPGSAKPSTATPGKTPGTTTPAPTPSTTTPGGGAAGFSGASPKTIPTVPPANPSDPTMGPSTLPGASSGASNTR